MAYLTLPVQRKHGGNLFAEIYTRLTDNGPLTAFQGNESFDTFQTNMAAVAGAEGHVLGNALKDMGQRGYRAFSASKVRQGGVVSEYQAYMDGHAKEWGQVNGFEGFSLAGFKGQEAHLKATNMTLNAKAHQQTPAAEELFKTLSIAYEDEGVEIKVRASGIGTYAYGNTAWQAQSILNPLFGLLRTGDVFKDEVLELFPVFPADEDSDDRALFVDPATIAPTTANYHEGDAFQRTPHLTQLLKVPSNIPNLLALTQVPGQRPWNGTDEIESNSITAERIQVTAKIAGTTQTFYIDTKSMSNNTLGVGGQIQTSDERQLNLVLRDHEAFGVLNKDNTAVGETLFAAIKTAGYIPLLSGRLQAVFNRMTNTFDLSSGQITISALRSITTGKDVRMGNASVQQKALLRSLTDGAISGVKVTFNATNNNRGNFGYRVEVFDATKHLSVQRRSPVSAIYPIDANDTNKEALDFAVDQMAVAINLQRSKNAFKKAREHLAFIQSIDGSPVVGNVGIGSNVLAGQHFVSAAAVERHFALKDVVSSVDSTGVFDAVSAAMTNEVGDIVSALNSKSGLAAIAEYGGTVGSGTNGAIEWSIIVHQNLRRFLMRSGDARTIGQDMPLVLIETNFDEMIGQLWIVPRNTSTSETINPLGGVGVCVSKENIVVHGNVTRDNKDHGVCMTSPTYKHWPLNVIIGSLTIDDAADFLGDEGLLTKLARQRVTIDEIGGVVQTEIGNVVQTFETNPEMYPNP